ncbi:hypothetical protein GcC1_067025 [Golovinomyces cichoracearum]|uniref:Uncharacterized protein n=1 Tax=Golovinomyces cichoracearum TaxID=62708 RepID=A0A420IR09_9PEZI|nr:hypothetical protein GcC1_067025 [Golovinomyces cichoracearum]
MKIKSSMIGITNLGSSFSIGILFLPGESKEDFIWAFQCFKELGINPAVVIDIVLALKNALKEVFSYVTTIHFIRQINLCVLAKCNSTTRNEDWPEFEASWSMIIQARTIY